MSQPVPFRIELIKDSAGKDKHKVYLGDTEVGHSCRSLRLEMDASGRNVLTLSLIVRVLDSEVMALLETVMEGD